MDGKSVVTRQEEACITIGQGVDFSFKANRPLC